MRHPTKCNSTVKKLIEEAILEGTYIEECRIGKANDHLNFCQKNFRTEWNFKSRAQTRKTLLERIFQTKLIDELKFEHSLKTVR